MDATILKTSATEVQVSTPVVNIQKVSLLSLEIELAELQAEQLNEDIRFKQEQAIPVQAHQDRLDFWVKRIPELRAQIVEAKKQGVVDTPLV